MRRKTYVLSLAMAMFCLSFGALSGVRPANAQNYVDFNQVTVVNQCTGLFRLLILRPPFISLPVNSPKLIVNAQITTLEDATERRFIPTGFLQPLPGSVCVFWPCSNYLIRLVCTGGIPVSVDWTRAPYRKRK